MATHSRHLEVIFLTWYEWPRQILNVSSERAPALDKIINYKRSNCSPPSHSPSSGILIFVLMPWALPCLLTLTLIFPSISFSALVLISKSGQAILQKVFVDRAYTFLCNELNVCGLSKFIGQSPNPTVMVFGGEAFGTLIRFRGEGNSHYMIGTFTGACREQRAFPQTCEDTVGWPSANQGEGPHQDSNHSATLILDF